MSTSTTKYFSPDTLKHDVPAGVVVFLVALPLCLGIALASGAPLFSGLVTGIIAGIVVGSLSGSHTSVSGPAAGLTAIVASQIAALGSFDAFLLAVVVGGVIQIALGIAKAGALSAYFPSSVIKGLLAAIGVILILKQIPHLLGRDSNVEGDWAFLQLDQYNTFTEIIQTFQEQIHLGAATVGLACLFLLVLWNRTSMLKNSLVPGPLVVVLVGVGLQLWFATLGGRWEIGSTHLVQIPVAQSLGEVVNFLRLPDFTQWTNPAIYVAGVTIAIVASLETLLCLEAVDKIDPQRRHSPPSRELLAQGVGNMIAGMVGGLPMTSVIVRSSVNVNTGARSKLSAIFHGILLLFFVVLFPVALNAIPLAALAAILIVTGFKLASPTLFRTMWNQGRYQFIPFITTIVGIVMTDLLSGIFLGLAVSIFFILRSNLRKPIRRVVETHIDRELLNIELANQVSFLNRAALDEIFNNAQPGSHVLIDASETDYIDPDVLSLIREFKEEKGPARGVEVSLRNFQDRYELRDEIRFADYSTRELQDRLTPEQVLDILKEGNRRFCSGNQLSHDYRRALAATAKGQTPLAVVLGCIDSRVPAEVVFDANIGDIFGVRVAGNVIGTKSLASIEYAVAVAGVKLVLVLGHTRCGAVTSSLKVLSEGKDVEEASGCQHLHAIVDEIGNTVSPIELGRFHDLVGDDRDNVVSEVVRSNVQHTVDLIIERSRTIRESVAAGKVKVVGAVYDIETGETSFLVGETASV
ncbi:SulP family inorganic anion transporter [Novipirellula sp. SH528]|uniref:SulP family inorganic anion transporter n=1 Tax=Novipirellula sp. SH528 TaxID=3454466 RepID=UPI003FA13F8D